MKSSNRRLGQCGRNSIASAMLGMGLVLSAGAAFAAPDITVTYTPLQPQSGLNVSVSADGGYVAYRLMAIDGKGGSTIYVYDVGSGISTQANLTINGVAPTNAKCEAPSISANGRYVIFGCDTAAMGGAANGAAYYVYDRIANKTEMLPNPTANRIVRTLAAAISADGHYVAYRAPDVNNVYSLFVRNMLNKTTRTSTAKDVYVGSMPGTINISADGRYLSYAGRVLPSSGLEDVSVFDSATSTTERINVSSAGVLGTKGGGYPVMSVDGSVVMFLSADNTLTTPSAPPQGGIFVRDRRAGTTELVSKTTAGGSIGNPTMSGNGRYIAYTGLNLYVYDRLTKNTRIVPGASNGTRAVTSTAFSADGRYLVFGSHANSNGMKSIGIADLGVAAGLNVSAGALSLTEGGAAATYTAVLAQVPDANVIVNITPGKQLSVARSQLTFTPENWNVPQVVSVQALNDGVTEGVHRSSIGHTVASSDINYSVVPSSSVNVTITDAVVPTIIVPAASWTQSDLPLTGTASPGATVMLTAVNRDTTWLTSVSTVADAQGRWSITLSGLTDGVFNLDAQADGIKSTVQTVTVALPVKLPAT
ncbi:hypothetical protein [Rugamonas sp. DEMB1]|uniref:hypothetical protein n=1 Tax=Rugamonas sp. DEMB1 TaxID=3039386 RepID=UPI0024481CD3|nr:hypothetical protein [Rugamonas sp. DEMB1]WGG51691.1 hypothetical protein QC826_05545 [Rugamonas sp. DEMB1]